MVRKWGLSEVGIVRSGDCEKWGLWDWVCERVGLVGVGVV